MEPTERQAKLIRGMDEEMKRRVGEVCQEHIFVPVPDSEDSIKTDRVMDIHHGVPEALIAFDGENDDFERLAINKDADELADMQYVSDEGLEGTFANAAKYAVSLAKGPSGFEQIMGLSAAVEVVTDIALEMKKRKIFGIQHDLVLRLFFRDQYAQVVERLNEEAGAED